MVWKLTHCLFRLKMLGNSVQIAWQPWCLPTFEITLQVTFMQIDGELLLTRCDWREGLVPTTLFDRLWPLSQISAISSLTRLRVVHSLFCLTDITLNPRRNSSYLDNVFYWHSSRKSTKSGGVERPNVLSTSRDRSIKYTLFCTIELWPKPTHFLWQAVFVTYRIFSNTPPGGLFFQPPSEGGLIGKGGLIFKPSDCVKCLKNWIFCLHLMLNLTYACRCVPYLVYMCTYIGIYVHSV